MWCRPCRPVVRIRRRVREEIRQISNLLKKFKVRTLSNSNAHFVTSLSKHYPFDSLGKSIWPSKLTFPITSNEIVWRLCVCLSCSSSNVWKPEPRNFILDIQSLLPDQGQCRTAWSLDSREWQLPHCPWCGVFQRALCARCTSYTDISSPARDMWIAHAGSLQNHISYTHPHCYRSNLWLCL